MCLRVNVLGCRSFRLEQNMETRQLQLTLAIGATFPLSVESVARKILHDPLEITIGERSVVTELVDQKVEIVTIENKMKIREG